MQLLVEIIPPVVEIKGMPIVDGEGKGTTHRSLIAAKEIFRGLHTYTYEFGVQLCKYVNTSSHSGAGVTGHTPVNAVVKFGAAENARCVGFAPNPPLQIKENAMRSTEYA